MPEDFLTGAALRRTVFLGATFLGAGAAFFAGANFLGAGAAFLAVPFLAGAGAAFLKNALTWRTAILWFWRW